jgi:ABC-type uncharacterized transport system auxiliary subunit
MKTATWKARLALPAALIFLCTFTACSNVLTSDEPARQYYTLMPLAGPGVGPSTESASVVALSVSAVPGLDTDRVLALAPDARLNRYANARWPDFLPEVLASVIKRSLLASGDFSNVELSDSPSEADITLKLEIRQFYGIRTSEQNTRSVLVEIGASVHCDGRNTLLTLTASKPVSQERLSSVVAAHQAGLDDFSSQLLDHVERLCPAS